MRKYKNLRYIDRIWLLVPIFLSFILLNFNTLREGDLWWHIKVGEEIIRLKGIPATDTFSFTAYSLPFYFSRSWLSDLVLFATYQLGRIPALVLLQALVGTMTVGVSLITSLNRGAAIRSSSTAVMFGFLGLFLLSTARPVMFSYLCFSLIIWVLYTYRYKGKNRLWLLPILMVFWTNLNSSWVAGLFLIGCFIGLSLIEKVVRREHLSKISSLLIWGLIAGLSILINPLGFNILEDISTALRNPVNQIFVSEWQPTTITNSFAWPFYLILGLLIITLAISEIRPNWIELFLILTFLVLSFRYIRILPYFYLIVTPTLALIMSGIKIPRLIPIRLDGVRQDNTDNYGNFLLSLFFGIVMLIVALFSLPQIRMKLSRDVESSLVSLYFPTGASDYLSQFNEEDVRLFSQPEWGGFLIWRHHPQMGVFIDGRVEQFPLDVWEDYFHITNAGPHWYEILREYEVDYLVLSKINHSKLITSVKDLGLTCPYEDSFSLVCIMEDIVLR